VTQQACPDLVPLVEAGHHDSDELRAAVQAYLGELLARDDQIDTLLLGCTHYPLLRRVIEETVGPGVAVVDSAFTAALAAEDLLDALGARAPAAEVRHRIATTGDVAAFTSVAERVFDEALPEVQAAELPRD
jgi:glutamate racemase